VISQRFRRETVRILKLTPRHTESERNQGAGKLSHFPAFFGHLENGRFGILESRLCPVALLLGDTARNTNRQSVHGQIHYRPTPIYRQASGSGSGSGSGSSSSSVLVGDTANDC